MTAANRENWIRAKGSLLRAITELGFPEELGVAVVRNLGSPKAMDRMTSYLKNVKPRKAEMVVDEMLAIMSEIADWRERKSSQEANAAINEMMYSGLDWDDDTDK